MRPSWSRNTCRTPTTPGARKPTLTTRRLFKHAELDEIDDCNAEIALDGADAVAAEQSDDDIDDDPTGDPTEMHSVSPQTGNPVMRAEHQLGRQRSDAARNSFKR